MLHYFSPPSEYERKVIQLLPENFREACQNSFWSLQRKSLRIFPEKSTFLFIFCGLYPQKPIQFLVERFWQACQKCNLMFERNIRRKTIFFWNWNNINDLPYSLWLRAKFFQNFDKNISASFSQLHFTFPSEECEQKFFFKTSFKTFLNTW